jgi:hypothetical protein
MIEKNKGIVKDKTKKEAQPFHRLCLFCLVGRKVSSIITSHRRLQELAQQRPPLSLQ